MGALDDIEDRLYAQRLEESLSLYSRRRNKYKENIRQTGYAEYDKFRHRIKRAFQALIGKRIMTREEWNSIVDKTVDKI